MKPKLEADYKRDFVKSMNRAGGYGRRIEDQFGVGIPDLLLSAKGTGLVSAEVKRFTGRQFAASERQREEMRRIRDGGGRVLIIGVYVPSEKCYAFGLPKNRDGRVFASECVVQNKEETFPDFFTRAIGVIYGRPVSESAGQEHPVQRGDDGDDAAGQPARGSGGQLPDDSQHVDGIRPVIDEAPSTGW